MIPQFRAPCRGVIRAAMVVGLLFVAAIPSGTAQPAGATKKVFETAEKTREAFGKLKPLQESQNWDGMIQVLDSVPLTPGSYDEVLILDMKAKLYIQKGQHAKAMEPWERVVQLNEQQGYLPEKQIDEVIFFLAQLYAQEGSSSKVPAQQQELFAKALTYFKRFMARTPKPTPEAMMTYATILYYKAAADPNKIDQALLAEARETVQRGLQSTGKPKEGFQQLLFTILQQQGDLVGSAEMLEMLLQQAPTKSKDLWQMLMATYLQLSEKSRETDAVNSREFLVRAIVTCERAQGLGFLNNPKDHMTLVSLYLMANQFSRGTELLYNGMKSGKIESEPNNWRVLGRYYVEANQSTQAIAVLGEAAQLFPKNGEIELQIAQLCLQVEKMREALAHAKSAAAKGNFEASTKPFNVYYLIAYTAYDLGEIEEAHRAIAEAEKYPEATKDPQFPKLKNVVQEAFTDLEAKSRLKTETEAAGKPKRAASL